MNRLLLALGVLLLVAFPTLANQGPPPKITTPQAVSPAVAAVAGAAGAVLAGFWIARRIKP